MKVRAEKRGVKIRLWHKCSLQSSMTHPWVAQLQEYQGKSTQTGFMMIKQQPAEVFILWNWTRWEMYWWCNLKTNAGGGPDRPLTETNLQCFNCRADQFFNNLKSCYLITDWSVWVILELSKLCFLVSLLLYHSKVNILGQNKTCEDVIYRHLLTLYRPIN